MSQAGPGNPRLFPQPPISPTSRCPPIGSQAPSNPPSPPIPRAACPEPSSPSQTSHPASCPCSVPSSSAVLASLSSRPAAMSAPVSKSRTCSHSHQGLSLLLQGSQPMGASLPPRKNPFMAQGLIPGVVLRLDVTVHGQRESHVTAVEDVTEDGIAVLTPMKQLRARPFATGTLVHASYINGRRQWKFVTEFSGTSPDGAVSHLRLPAVVESSERRSAYRLETAVRPLAIYRLVINSHETARAEGADSIQATIVDLSEGGLCFTSRQSFVRGERLGLQAELPNAGQIHARLRVTAVDEPERGNVNRRMHCQFTDISLTDRDRIARYLMRRQLEMRRRGQL
ncbi:MAG: hypothetical protein C0506_10495 [Anaerolinea sp.]|nr:hypothetical protein [Anaerolinea sp.]